MQGAPASQVDVIGDERCVQKVSQFWRVAVKRKSLLSESVNSRP